MIPLHEVIYSSPIKVKGTALLVGDLGGTNSNFGLFDVYDNRCTLLLALHAKSQQVASFAQLVQQILAYLKTTYAITVKPVCLAAAGPLNAERTFIKPTNLSIVLDAHEIMREIPEIQIVLANDFEIIGYGIPHISRQSIVSINNREPCKSASKAIIGAGTGLGKCILYWDTERSMYMPLASEGGHADFPVQSQREFDLINFIRKTENRTVPLSWEDLLSGKGIQRMYHFLRHADHSHPTNKETQNSGPAPDEIFKSRMLDLYCQQTFELYTTFYARCAKDFALDTLSRGGLYIAGGIAAHNVALFELPAFHDEFMNASERVDVVAQIPLFVITDYDVSLYGAANYMLSQGLV